MDRLDIVRSEVVLSLLLNSTFACMLAMLGGALAAIIAEPADPPITGILMLVAPAIFVR